MTKPTPRFRLRTPQPEHFPKLAEIPPELVAAAKHNLATEGIRRWWCRKYRLPPTDDRYLAYTHEQLFVEFIEDALERGFAKPGIEKRYLPDGTPVARTGDAEIDADELDFARKALREIEDELRRGIVRRHPKLQEDDTSPSSPDTEALEEELVLGGFRDND